jgi:hypothetical protein
MAEHLSNLATAKNCSAPAQVTICIHQNAALHHTILRMLYEIEPRNPVRSTHKTECHRTRAQNKQECLMGPGDLPAAHEFLYLSSLLCIKLQCADNAVRHGKLQYMSSASIVLQSWSTRLAHTSMRCSLDCNWDEVMKKNCCGGKNASHHDNCAA